MNDIERHLAWQQLRHDELAAPDSWLGLIGLDWLEAGSNAVGSDPACLVRLPGGPGRLGELRVEEGGVRWLPASAGLVTVEGGQAMDDGVWRLRSDAAGEASCLRLGDLEMFLIEREGRLAVRLRDRNWGARKPLAGLGYFPFDPAWRVAADWQELPAPLEMAVPNASGDLITITVRQQARFAVAGQEVSLLPMAVSEEEVFFVFRDRTSGKETYGAGRFLKAAPARDGKITLDFNYAYNPPCAFTPFATCPLPPPENWLPFPVTAGEKKPLGK